MISYFDKNTNKIWTGLSSDIKPVNSENNEQFSNGEIFYEMDTTHVYLFDAQNNEWLPQFQSEVK